MATHSTILAWRIPWAEELGGLQSIDHKESYPTEHLTHTHTHWNVGRNAKWFEFGSTKGERQQNSENGLTPLFTVFYQQDIYHNH